MAGDDPILHSGVTATLGEFGVFEKVSGGNPTTAFTEYYQAGSLVAEQIPGTHSYSDLVLERAYRPGQDAGLRNWDTAYRTGFEKGRTVTKLITNHQKFVVDTLIYPDAEPVSVEMPDGEAGSNAIAMVRVTLKVKSRL